MVAGRAARRRQAGPGPQLSGQFRPRGHQEPSAAIRIFSRFSHRASGPRRIFLGRHGPVTRECPLCELWSGIMGLVITAGKIYGRLTVLAETRKAMPDGTVRRAAECRCDCGTITTVQVSDLKRDMTRSCGCLSREKSAQRGRARVRHVVRAGDRFGRLTVIREVRLYTSDGKATRSALCCCDCGNRSTPAVSSLILGDTRSCDCSRGRPKYKWKRCPACGTLARIRRDRRACSRSCGYQLARAARQSADPSADVLHHRVKKTRGPASNYACVDCGGAAEDWSTADSSSDDVWGRFQPRCRKCHRRYDGAVGEGHPKAKLTAERVRELRARRADGLTYRQLADEFGISDVSAYAAVNRRTWAHVA